MATTNGTALQKLSTSSLDLTNLPDRLDDTMLRELTTIARSPLPALPACSERHFNQCMRLMDAVLPKRSSDDVSGKLMAAAYRRMLGNHSEQEISFLAERAMATCKWMPTIAECLEILGEWRRNDEYARAQTMAANAIMIERRHREQENNRKAGMDVPEITQKDIDNMSPDLIRLGLTCGALIENSDGSISVAPKEDDQ